MAELTELETMIEILSLAIARQQTEEQFFRRSAAASSSETAKALFTEVAEELRGCRKNLEKRRQHLLDELNDLL